MDIQLSQREILETQQLLHDYQPAQTAIAALEQHDGSINASFDQLWVAENGRQSFGEHQSIWQVAREEFRREICSDEGFCTKIKDYLKKPADAAALTAAIIYLLEITALAINPAMATIVVLYVAKVGLNIFCKYTGQFVETEESGT